MPINNMQSRTENIERICIICSKANFLPSTQHCKYWKNQIRKGKHFPITSNDLKTDFDPTHEYSKGVVPTSKYSDDQVS